MLLSSVQHPNEFNSDLEEVVGHIPKLMAPHVTKFLKRRTNYGKVTVIGKQINRGAGYGFELPCEYLLYGDDFCCESLPQRLSKEGFDCADYDEMNFDR